ncbi:MAG: hypothetical protein C4547_08240 [Phycisphaerales bacterium]|nr:MAG: hypothetical protein C4547_08240 [Phycisphaerales bacterium]
MRQYGHPDACAGCPHGAACCHDPTQGRLVSRDPYEEHRERLRGRMATQEGRNIYKRRKRRVELRFGHIKRNMGVRRFLRRGMDKVKTEWSLVCTAVNPG